MEVVVTLKNEETGDERKVSFNENDLKRFVEENPDEAYDRLGDQICKSGPVGETNVIECGCPDYIDDFEITGCELKAQ